MTTTNTKATPAQRKQALRVKIMTKMQTVGIEVTGDFWFSLIFRTESEMKKLAKEIGCN